MKKPLKVAAISGLISFLLSVIIIFYRVSIRQQTNNAFLAIVGLVGIVLGIFFLYGFIILSKKFNNKLLMVMSWIGIAFGIIFAILGFVGNLISPIQNVTAQAGNIGAGENVPELTAALLLAFLV